ncbi:MAG: type III-B CRISPR module RAMP protein Cmr4 [candidate division WOR-3 bacterium]
MYKDFGILTYYTLTPLHMGSGSSVHYVDLTIQRERHTSFPIMAGSGIKGVLRDYAKIKWNDNSLVDEIFGYEDGNKGASMVAFTDAKILLYPVRSLKGTFAWITCPLVLKRFKEELKSLGKTEDTNWDVPNLDPDKDKALVSKDSSLVIDDKSIGLEEFVFDCEKSENVDNIAKAIKEYLPHTSTVNELSKRLVVVGDNVFTDFVNYAIEIRTRIRIDQETGTVKEGALFTIEFVPSEAIFYRFVFFVERKKDDSLDVRTKFEELFSSEDKDKANKDKVKELVLQFGGDETIGAGFTKVRYNTLK